MEYAKVTELADTVGMRLPMKADELRKMITWYRRTISGRPGTSIEF